MNDWHTTQYKRIQKKKTEKKQWNFGYRVLSELTIAHLVTVAAGLRCLRDLNGTEKRNLWFLLDIFLEGLR